jgi:hypothetical protein
VPAAPSCSSVLLGYYISDYFRQCTALIYKIHCQINFYSSFIHTVFEKHAERQQYAKTVADLCAFETTPLSLYIYSFGKMQPYFI